jgi:hypothetical protein
MAFYAEDILNKQKSNSGNITITDVTRGTATGAIIGLVGGGLYAYFYEKKYFGCMLVGTLVGGLISRIFLIEK